MPPKVLWRPSWQAMKDALEFTKKISLPVAWLIVGQILLMILVFLLIVGFTGTDNIYQRVYGGGLEPALQVLAVVLSTTYALIYSIVIMVLVRNPKLSLVKVLKTTVYNKILPSIGLFILFVIGLFVTLALFVIPGVIYYIYFSLVLYILILEDTSLLEAFKRSYRYIKGWWWPMLARIILIIAILTAVSLFGLVPFYGIPVVYAFTLLLTPVFLVYVTQTYLELRSAKSKNPIAPFGLSYKMLTLLWALVVLTLFSTVTALTDFVNEVSSITPEEAPEQFFQLR